MTAGAYITSYCSISKGVIHKNEKVFFEDRQSSLPDLLIAAYRQAGFNYPKFYKMDNLGKLGWLAAEVLLKDSFTAGNYRPGDIAVVLSNRNSSLDTDIRYFESVRDIASPALFVYTLPNIVIGEICIRHGFKGENAFFINETFDAGFIEQYVNNLVNNDILQCCICGWVEILGDQYKTVLFLVEKKAPEGAIPFTEENIIKIYESDNG